MKPNIFEDALQSQDASNLSGIVLSLAQMMPAIRKDATARGINVSTHPVVKLFAEQIRFLSGSGEGYLAAHDECEKRARELELEGEVHPAEFIAPLRQGP